MENATPTRLAEASSPPGVSPAPEMLPSAEGQDHTSVYLVRLWFLLWCNCVEQLFPDAGSQISLCYL